MLIILAIILFLAQNAIPRTIDDFPFQSAMKCDQCFRIYFPLCASNNLTYTNECRFRCAMSKLKSADRAKIVRYGPCVLNSRRKRFATNFYFQEFA